MKKGITGSVLKTIALVSMFIDHLGAVLVEKLMFVHQKDSYLYEKLLDIDVLLRSVGRIAFPIYCFLLVEGFLHTKNVKKYIARMAFFALVSEVPFDLALSGVIIDLSYQNVFFTLLIGLCTITCLDYIWKRKEWFPVLKAGLYIVVIMLGAYGAEYICADYGLRGVLPIVILYLMRFNRMNQVIAGGLSFYWELPAPIAFLPVLFYNGQRGKGNKYLFYIFYPLHLLLLYFAAVCLGLF